MAPPKRTQCKPKGGIAAVNQPNNPASVNPAAANDTAFATGSTAKRSHLEHSTPNNATAKNTMEPNPPAAVAVHPATANNANVLSRGDMPTTVDGSDRFDYGNLTILSLLSLLLPAAVEVLSLILNLLDGKISASNTMERGNYQGL
jgi:hypothetical protein